MRALLAVWILAGGSAAHALSPSEVFEKVSPSVWAVRGLDSQERPLTYGSGVVIGPGRLVTNCHVLAKAKAVQVRRDNVIYEGKLEHADAERDLCTLTVANFSAPPVAILPLERVRIGQRVYAVGNPEKLALTLSEGLISGLRSEDPQLPPVQTTAPISPGSSGGGLFDDQGRLIGITTLIVVGRLRVAQNLNFAMPAGWIAEVPERAKEQLARRHGGSASGTAKATLPGMDGLPAVGASWKYSFRDERYAGSTRAFTIRIDGVSGASVTESFIPERGAPATSSINAQETRFSSKRLTGDYAVVELAPYLYASDRRKDAYFVRPEGYATDEKWQIDPVRVSDEEVVVPAGTYKAVRVEVSGTSLSFGSPPAGASASRFPARFHYTAWYAAEVNRYVKVRHETWNRVGVLVGDEVVQLLEYKH